MRILLICNLYDKNHVIRILVKNNIAQFENIIHVPNFEAAYDFIDKMLILRQGHIDLIITADKMMNNPFDIHLVDQIRYSSEEYSNTNFKVKSLPVILYDREITSSDYFQYGFNARIERHEYDNQQHLADSIRSIVKSGRSAILDDLDLLRIDSEELQNGYLPVLDPYYLLRIKPDPYYWASRTKILSESFIKTPRLLDYDWFLDNKVDWEKEIDRYEDIIKNLACYNRVNSEKRVLHALYNKALWLLRLDVFHKPVYEPALVKNGAEYEEPDYVLPSSLPGYISTNILEVKPHLFPILHRRKRKPGFKRNFQDAMEQVADYQRYVRKEKGRRELDKLVNYESSKLSFTLLASNDKEKEINLKRIEELQRGQFPKIKTETHNDRLRAVIAYFERNQRLHVLN